MGVWRRVLLFAASGLAGAGAARAEDVFPLAQDPVLATLVAEALEKNPDLRMAEASAVGARARIPQASALPDPTLTLGYQNGGRGLGLGSDDDTWLGFSVSQPVPFPGKRRLAEAVESKQAARAEQPVNRSRLTLVKRVRRAFTDLLLARERLRLLETQERTAEAIEQVSRSRYGVGLAEQADVLRAQAELSRLRQMRFHEEGGVISAQAALNRLLARPAGTECGATPPLAVVAEHPPDLPALAALLARAEAGSPEIAAARLGVEGSRAALDLARRMLKPDFVATAGYMNRGSLPGQWLVEFGIVAPIYAGRKQRQAIAEAEARLRSDQAALEAVRLRARARAEQSYAELAATLREAQAYRGGVLAVDVLAADSALANYQTGKVPFVSVLEAHATLFRDRWEYAELLAHVLWHSADLDELSAEDQEGRS